MSGKLIEVFDVESLDLQKVASGVVLLPDRDICNDGVERYLASAISVKKVLSGVCDVSFYSMPERVLEQRSVDWFGPAILIMAQAYNANPDIVKTVLDAVVEHVKKLYEGKSDPTIKLEILCEKKNGKTLKSIRYEGSAIDAGALLDMVEKAFKE